MVIGNDPVVMLSTMADPVYDYVALGHVHRQQVLCDTPAVVYSGSLERLDFGDEDVEKGFYEIEIEHNAAGKTVKYSFHMIAARRFLTLEIEIADEDLDPTGIILTKIGERIDEIKDAVVRLKVSMPGHLDGMLRDGDIFKALKEAYNVSIIREVRRAARSRGSGWVKQSLTPLEALHNYLDGKDMTAERRKILLEYAEKLIKEKLSEEKEAYAG